MPAELPTHPLRWILNPRAQPGAPYGDARRAVLNLAAGEVALRELVTWPDYAPTPMWALTGLAQRAGLRALWFKDESPRFGLGTFKALGGAYAVLRLLQREIAGRMGREPLAKELASGNLRFLTRNVTVTCATAGSHGRSVAWGARLFGCPCVVYLSEQVSPAREAAIATQECEIVRVPGTYDDAVRAAARDAQAQGRHVVSDTSYAGYLDVPRDVMQGYSAMMFEALSQVPEGERPTHVFVQAGVGGLAAAVCAHLWETWGAQRPRFVIVEPERADCLLRSAQAGQLTRAEGDLATIMAGLAAGEVSLLAWEILATGADAFLAVPDAAAEDAMRLLAAGSGGDPPVVAGESAAAGLAGLLCALGDADSRSALGLDADSRVLLFGTEGASDPESYARIVGRPADQVRPA